MKESLTFWKMQGTGNHFAVFKVKRSNWNLFTPAFVRRLCDPHFGIGADGVLVFDRLSKADVPVLMRNPDGSAMGMCGNGIRCVYKRFYEEVKGEEDVGEVTFDVEGRKILCRKCGDLIEVDMGVPSLIANEIPIIGDPLALEISAAGEIFRGVAVSIGNPHFVVFSDSRISIDKLRKIGPLLENSTAFPQRANIEFATVDSDDRISLTVWERGAGYTLGCGTAACATVVAGVSKGLISNRVTVNLPGGEVEVFWDKATNRVYLRGPAQDIYRGEIEIC